MPCTTEDDCPFAVSTTTTVTSTTSTTTLVSPTIISLPIPPDTTFLSADNGGVSDGSTITWMVFSNPCAGPGGISGTPLCPVLRAELTVNAGATVGTVLENQVTYTPPGLTPQLSSIIRTTIGSFRLGRFVLGYVPARPGRDRLAYRAFITLGPGQAIDIATEAFAFQVDAPGVIQNFSLPPGSVLPSSAKRFSYRSREPGLKRVAIREIAPGHYNLRLRARQLDMPEPAALEATITVTFGDDDLVQSVPLLVKRGGRRYVGAK